VEIKYDDTYYNWSDGAERVHGMSREYLEEHGMSQKDAAIKIAGFIEQYYGPIEQIRKLPLLGHNVATFDRYFLHDLLDQADIRIQFGNRHIDTFSLGVTLMDLFSSDELFDFFGLKRDATKHNALEDAKHALKVARLMKKHFQSKE
jgi:DNA polymerase III epsilon subunit-like protein